MIRASLTDPMLAHFLAYGRPYRRRYLGGFLLLVATNGLSLGIPWLLRDAVAAMERRAGPATIAAIASGMVALALGQAIVRTLSRIAILGASRHVVCDVRERFFRQLSRLAATFYDRQRTGDIMSRGINDLQLLRSFYGPGLLNLANTILVYVAVLTVLFTIDVRLTLLSLLVYPPLFVGVNQLSRRMYALSRRAQEQLAVIGSRAQENFSGIQQVKTYVQEEREIAAFSRECAEFRRRNLAMAAVRGAMLSLIGVVAGCGSLLVLYAGGRYVALGRITFPDFVAFFAYLGLLAWPTIAFGWIVNVFQRGVGAMERVQEILRLDPDIPSPLDAAGGLDEGKEEASLEEPPAAGAVEVRGLTFSYERAASPALIDVSLSIPAGGSVGIVGSVGSGKSTLLDLIARVYPAPAGTIFIDGEDLTALPTERVRRLVGYVPQEAFLFSRSLRENVAFGALEPGEDEVQRAIESARLAEDIDVFPAGLDTVVGERGFTLSGGQRQRATLARALLRDPRILILDDVLSSVDADTERAILSRLATQLRGRTCLFVSHRLSTLAAMDRIVVLDGGRLVESGTHAELIERNGVYARLAERSRLERRLEGP